MKLAFHKYTLMTKWVDDSLAMCHWYMSAFVYLAQFEQGSKFAKCSAPEAVVCPGMLPLALFCADGQISNSASSLWYMHTVPHTVGYAEGSGHGRESDIMIVNLNQNESIHLLIFKNDD